MINFGFAGADLSGRRDRDPDHRRQFRRRLDARRSIRGAREKAHERRVGAVGELQDNSIDPRRSRHARRSAHRRGRGPGAGRRRLAARFKRGEVIGLIGESGRRQIDDRARLDGLYAPRLRYRRRRHRLRRQGHPAISAGRAPRAARARHRLYRPERGGVVQPGDHADGPGLRSADPPWRAVGGARRARKRCSLFRELDLPDPETIGSRYPHQVSGGQLQRVMAAMAMVGQARHPRVRRADDRARRDDAGRMPRRLPQAHPRARHGGALHHPRPRRRRPDRRPHHGAASRQDGRVRRLAADPAAAERRIYPPPGRRARSPATSSSKRTRANEAADPRDRPCQRRLSRANPRSSTTSPSPCARATRWRWSANPGPANRRSPASSWGFCRAAPATCGSTAPACRRG